MLCYRWLKKLQEVGSQFCFCENGQNIFCRLHQEPWLQSLSPSCTAPLWLIKGNTLLDHCWCPAKGSSSQILWDRRSASWETKAAATVQQLFEFQLVQTTLSCSGEMSVQPQMHLFTFKAGRGNKILRKWKDKQNHNGNQRSWTSPSKTDWAGQIQNNSCSHLRIRRAPVLLRWEDYNSQNSIRGCITVFCSSNSGSCWHLPSPRDTPSIPDISSEAASPDTCFCNHCPIITHSII